MRNDDLRIARTPLVGGIQQILERLDTRLGLGLAGLRAGLDPLALAADGALAGVVLAAFLLEALGLGFEVFGVVALIGNAAAAIEFEDPAGDVVEKVAVVGDDQDRAGIFAQMFFQPAHRFGIKVVGRLVEQQQLGFLEQEFAERDAPFLAARKLGDIGVARRASQGIHCLFDLRLEIPEILAVDLLLE